MDSKELSKIAGKVSVEILTECKTRADIICVIALLPSHTDALLAELKIVEKTISRKKEEI